MYMYIFIYINIYILIYVYVSIYIYIHIYIYIYIHVYSSGIFIVQQNTHFCTCWDVNVLFKCPNYGMFSCTSAHTSCHAGCTFSGTSAHASCYAGCTFSCTSAHTSSLLLRQCNHSTGVWCVKKRVGSGGLVSVHRRH